MSKSINQVLLIGNIGKDPEVRTLDGGMKVSTFSLATSTGGYKKQDGTDVPEKTQWHNIVCWRSLADICEKYVHKGDRLTVFGQIQYREYEKDGVKKYATDIIATDLLLPAKADNPGGERQPAPAAAPASSNFPPAPQPQESPWQNDLPF